MVWEIYKINNKNELPSKPRGLYTLFIKHNFFGKLIALIVYVDNIIVIGIDEGEIQKLKPYLCNEFEIKDLGSLKYFLRLRWHVKKGGIFISKLKYILYLLKETKMLGCKLVETSIE